jgi:hypothetical protein
MQQYGNVNDLSQQLRDSVPALEDGQVVSFRLLGGIADSTSNGVKRFGSAKAIPLHDKIKDPFTGKIVEIGIVLETNDLGKPTRWAKHWVQPEGANLVHNGQFTLRGGNAEDEEKYIFFCLTNMNATNKNRSTKEDPWFEVVDENKDLAIRAGDVDVLFKALSQVSLMDIEDLREFAAVENWDPQLSKESLLTKIKLYAKENPEVFIEKRGNPDNAKMLKIQKAFEKNIIQYNHADSKVVWGHNGKTIALVTDEDGENEVQKFFAWTKQSGNGSNILNAIIKQLSAVK